MNVTNDCKIALSFKIVEVNVLFSKRHDVSDRKENKISRVN